MKPWFALQVHGGREKWIASYLNDLGFEHLLLLRQDARSWSDRVKTIETPLFEGYVFCRFDPEERGRVLAGPGVLRVVGYGKTPAPVDDAEIAALQTVSASGLPLSEHPYLKQGDFVVIEGGPLDGLVGCYVRAGTSERVVVSVSLLQRSVAAEIDRSQLTLIHPITNPKPNAKSGVAPGLEARKAG